MSTSTFTLLSLFTNVLASTGVPSTSCASGNETHCSGYKCTNGTGNPVLDIYYIIPKWVFQLCTSSNFIRALGGVALAISGIVIFTAFRSMMKNRRISVYPVIEVVSSLFLVISSINTLFRIPMVPGSILSTIGGFLPSLGIGSYIASILNFGEFASSAFQYTVLQATTFPVAVLLSIANLILSLDVNVFSKITPPSDDSYLGRITIYLYTYPTTVLLIMIATIISVIVLGGITTYYIKTNASRPKLVSWLENFTLFMLGALFYMVVILFFNRSGHIYEIISGLINPSERSTEPTEAQRRFVEYLTTCPQWGYNPLAIPNGPSKINVFSSSTTLNVVTGTTVIFFLASIVIGLWYYERPYLGRVENAIRRQKVDISCMTLSFMMIVASVVAIFTGSSTLMIWLFTAPNILGFLAFSVTIFIHFVQMGFKKQEISYGNKDSLKADSLLCTLGLTFGFLGLVFSAFYPAAMIGGIAVGPVCMVLTSTITMITTITRYQYVSWIIRIHEEDDFGKVDA